MCLEMSLSEQIAALVNPVPEFHDPEDDHDNDTVAKVTDFADTQYGNEASVPVTSSLRARAFVTFKEADPRYAGKSTSRKKISKLDGQDDESEDATAAKESDVDMEAIKHFKERMARRTNINYDPSDESSEESDDDSEQPGEKTDERIDYNPEKNASTMLTFSAATPKHLQDDAEKGRAIKRQLALWDALLKSRIQMQKVMVAANQVPQHDVWSAFHEKGGQNFDDVVDDCRCKVRNLLDDLLNLQTSLLASNPETRTVLDPSKTTPKSAEQDPNNEEILSDDEDDEVDNKEKIKEIVQKNKRKLTLDEYPEFLNKRHGDFQRFQDATIQKWNERTKLTRGKMKSFDKFEQSTLKQIEHVLYDKPRLIKRTQMKRIAYVTLGRNSNEIREIPINQLQDSDELTAVDDLNETNAEIFDDNDFYHQILREVIERKTATVGDSFSLGRQWLQIQKLRCKMKKKVDTKASKGRKIRYDVHAKLVNFMAPIDTTSLPDEAKNELFNSLFGKRNKMF